MAKASDYNVTFPFKGQDGTYYGPNGSIGLYHLGDDRACPIGTDVFNGSSYLGDSGKTGAASGPHLHSAKWKPGNVAGGYYEPRLGNTYFKPDNIFNAPGVVWQAGESGGTGGTLVRWRGDDGYNYEQFHLSSVSVKVNERIGQENSMSTLGPYEVDALTKGFFGYAASPADINESVGKESNERIRWFFGNPAFTAREKLPVDLVAENTKLKQQVAAGTGNCTADERAYLDLLKKVVK